MSRCYCCHWQSAWLYSSCMPDYSYAILSALLWASSAPIINHGLTKLPKQHRFQWICYGLFFAMLAGAISLSPFLLIIDMPLEINVYLLLAGVFTFPLATSTYYLSGEAFSGRTEFASQFSKIKPLLSFAFAVLILHESITSLSLVSISLIALGTVIFIWAASKHSLSRKGVFLGLMAALFWALGELFMKLGISDIHPILANFVAIVSGILISAIFILRGFKSVTGSTGIITTLWPFMLHGIVSFGAAYTFFFYSVKEIGLAHSVLINAFWPILSILITAAIRTTRKRPVDIPPILLVASLILLFGSLLQAFAR